MLEDYEVYYLDPHASGVGVNLVNRIAGHPNLAKLMFLKESFIKGEIIPLVYCGSSYPLFRIKMPVFLNRMFSYFEFLEWGRYNKIKSKVRFSLKKNEKKKIVIVDSNTEFRNKYKFLERLSKSGDVQFLFYTTHLHARTNQKIALFQKLPRSLFFSEAFPQMPDSVLKGAISKENFILCPYGIKDYFMEHASPALNEKAQNRILVVGSIIRSDARFEKDLLENFNSKLLHPLRVELFDRRKEISDIFYNVAEEYKYTTKKGSNKYFSLDMNQVYPEYKYFICPEDVIGMPSGNMVEGMALGSVYFGNEKCEYLNDYGMRPWVHYIPYDGTIDGAYAAYRKIEIDGALYKKIRKNGMEFVVHNFGMNSLLKIFSNGLRGSVKGFYTKHKEDERGLDYDR